MDFEKMRMAVALAAKETGIFLYELSNQEQNGEGWFKAENRFELDDFFEQYKLKNIKHYEIYTGRLQANGIKLQPVEPFWVRFMPYTNKHQRMAESLHSLPHAKTGEHQTATVGLFKLSKTEPEHDEWFVMENKQELKNFLEGFNVTNVQGKKRELIEETFSQADIGDEESYYLKFYSREPQEN